MKRNGTWLLVIALSFVLVGCNISTEEGAEKGFDVSEEVMQNKVLQPNETVGTISLHLPEKYVIGDVHDDYNVTIEKGKEQYLLFVNPHELATSEKLYETTLEQTEGEYSKAFPNDESFVYVVVSKVDDNRSQVVTGVGGHKLTTIVKNKRVERVIEPMLTIIRSVHLESGEDDEIEDQTEEQLEKQEEDAA